MKANLWVALITATIAMVGCVSDQAYRAYVSEGTYPAKNAESVAILYQRPVEQFEVIADLQARGNAIEAFRKEAGKLGADAIIISHFGGTIADATYAGGDKGQTFTRIVGTAIKYKSSEKE
jgi:uncharacterized protein YbjQ (UPF0145 family)